MGNPTAPFDSTIGKYILDPGNTKIEQGGFNSPIYSTATADAGWQAWINNNGGEILFIEGMADPLEPLVHIKMPVVTSYPWDFP